MKDEALSVEAITRGLRTRVLGQRVLYYERVGSTNDVARQLADVGEPEGTLVIADEQNAGRGRLGRTWVAPPRSSLLMSLVLRPTLLPQQMTRVTMAVALGVCNAIRTETGLDARIKWPNDILLSRGKKCAGILAESGTVGDELEYVIVGLGVNVNFAAALVVANHHAGNLRPPEGGDARDDLRKGLPRDATTIADELGRSFPRVRLAQAILQWIEQYYLRLGTGANLRAEWMVRLATLRQRVRAQTPWGIEKGVAEDVDDDGALLLRRMDGTIVRLIAGDVTLSEQGEELL